MSACHTLHQLMIARRDTIDKLLDGADYLDSVWLRCRVSRTLGTSTSLVGGGLTIAGGMLTLATMGVGAPVLIAGIATSSVGAAANIGTSVIEKVVNSRQVKALNLALERDKTVMDKLRTQMGSLKKYESSAKLRELMKGAETLLGEDHLLLLLLRGELHLEENTPTLASSCSCVAAPESDDSLPSQARTLLTQTSRDDVNYSVMDTGVLVESSKVIGQNTFKATGQVVVGLSAVFMVWDAIDLGQSISDLVRREGSQAGKLLRGRAGVLESALQDTLDKWRVRIP